MQFLEQIKAQRRDPRHSRRIWNSGRKVVVFHDFNKGGNINPFLRDVR